MAPKLRYNSKLKKHSRNLKKNMTDAEHLLWSRVRRKQLKGLQFYRQRVLGNYIVDFYCPRANLVIELDGGQHYSEKGRKKDEIRDAYLTALGLKVVRFSDREVFENTDGIIDKIWECLEC